MSIGIVQPGEPYAFDMGGFVPYRRNVSYLKSNEASILPLLMILSLWKTAAAGATSFALACSPSATMTCG